jgi:hypothetical protein
MSAADFRAKISTRNVPFKIIKYKGVERNKETKRKEKKRNTYLGQ